MTNWEKYKDEIMKNVACGGFSKENGKIKQCYRNECVKCDFNNNYSEECDYVKDIWLNSEYKELLPYADWKIDDKIEVSNDGNTWQKRHFAGIDENGNVLAWTGGLTSWNTISKSVWEFARKVEK